MLSLDDFSDYFNIDIENDNYDTVSGFIVDLLGRIPETTEEEKY